VRASAITLLALTAALWCEAAPARAAGPLPPDLVMLEQRMAQLQANSERFSFGAEVSLGGLFGQGVPLVLLLTGAGEASDSPPQVRVEAGLLGLPQEQARLIGNTSYRYRPEAGEIDGGRPWVRGPVTSQQAQGLDPGGILESDQAGRQGTFSKLVEELGGALSIEESGLTTVDDQRVIEFDAALDPTPVLRQLESHAPNAGNPLNSPFQLPSVGGPGSRTPGPPPKLELEAFIAPNGLPVRLRVSFSAEGSMIAVRVDTLAINVPVRVTPPPARQTIDEARLQRIERRRAARALRRALRACRHLHGKRASACRRLAHLRSRPPSTEGSLI